MGSGFSHAPPLAFTPTMAVEGGSAMAPYKLVSTHTALGEWQGDLSGDGFLQRLKQADSEYLTERLSETDTQLYLATLEYRSAETRLEEEKAAVERRRQREEMLQESVKNVIMQLEDETKKKG
eukprot:Sspe_Gene.57347::Locus_31471_Transcript_1_1_Confidence_1.000_Length_719::g.57347::m.57347